MLISDQSGVPSQVCNPFTELYRRIELEKLLVLTKPISKTNYCVDDDRSPPSYEDAMAMRYMSTSLHM